MDNHGGQVKIQAPSTAQLQQVGKLQQTLQQQQAQNQVHYQRKQRESQLEFEEIQLVKEEIGMSNIFFTKIRMQYCDTNTTPLLDQGVLPDNIFLPIFQM